MKNIQVYKDKLKEMMKEEKLGAMALVATGLIVVTMVASAPTVLPKLMDDIKESNQMVSLYDKEYYVGNLYLLTNEVTGDKYVCTLEKISSDFQPTVGMKISGNMGTNGIGVQVGKNMIVSAKTNTVKGYVDVSTGEVVGIMNRAKEYRIEFLTAGVHQLNEERGTSTKITPDNIQNIVNDITDNDQARR